MTDVARRLARVDRCNPSSGRRRAAIGAVWLVVLTITGCEDAQRDSRGAVSDSPSVVVEKLIDARRRGAYQEFDQLITPQRARSVRDTLIAIDDFLHANRELIEHVRRQHGHAIADAIDQSYFERHLEIFSRRVELLDEVIDRDQATVNCLVEDRVPVVHARLRRVDGHWRYDPGPGFDPDLPRAWQQMATGLRQVLSDLRTGRISSARIDDDPEILFNEVMLRLAPGARSLPTPAVASDEPG